MAGEEQRCGEGQNLIYLKCVGIGNCSTDSKIVNILTFPDVFIVVVIMYLFAVTTTTYHC